MFNVYYTTYCLFRQEKSAEIFRAREYNSKGYICESKNTSPEFLMRFGANRQADSTKLNIFVFYTVYLTGSYSHLNRRCCFYLFILQRHKLHSQYCIAKLYQNLYAYLLRYSCLCFRSFRISARKFDM